MTLGPGTLYAILGKFQEEALIKETWSQGRMRVYRITDAGRTLFRRELENMRRCVGTNPIVLLYCFDLL